MRSTWPILCVSRREAPGHKIAMSDNTRTMRTKSNKSIYFYLINLLIIIKNYKCVTLDYNRSYDKRYRKLKVAFNELFL